MPLIPMTRFHDRFGPSPIGSYRTRELIACSGVWIFTRDSGFVSIFLCPLPNYTQGTCD